MNTDRETTASPQEPACSIPEGSVVYKRTPDFNQDTIPEGLLRAHSTKRGVWGRICVTEGMLAYRVLDERRLRREWLLTPSRTGVVEPEILHEVEPRGEVTFFVEFLRSSATESP